MAKNCQYVARTLPNLLQSFDHLSDDIIRAMPDCKARDHVVDELRNLKKYVRASYPSAHSLICEADDVGGQ